MKNNWLNRNLICFSLTSLFNDFCHEMVAGLLPAYIQQIVHSNYGPLILGVIEGVAEAASSAMRLFSGWVTDRISIYKPFLIMGYGFTAIFFALIGTAQSISAILLYRTIAWISRGFREPMRDTILSKSVTWQYYGRVFGFHRAFDTIGAILGPLTAFILVNNAFEIKTIIFISLIPGLISIVPLFFIVTSSVTEHAAKKYINLKAHVKELPRSFNYFVLVMLLFGMGNFHQGLFIYRVQELFTNTTTSSLVASGWAVLFYTFFNIVRACAEFGIGALSDYVSKKNLLAIFGCGTFLISNLGFMVNATQLWFWFIFFGFAGLSYGTVKTLKRALGASLLPESVRGTGFGILQALEGIGFLISSVVVGLLWSLFSPLVAFSYAAIISLISLVLLLNINLNVNRE